MTQHTFLSIAQALQYQANLNFQTFPDGILKNDVISQQYFKYVLSDVIVKYNGKPFGGRDKRTHIIDLLELESGRCATRHDGGFQGFAKQLGALLEIKTSSQIDIDLVRHIWDGFVTINVDDPRIKEETLIRLHGALNKLRDLAAMKKVNVHSIDVNI